MTLLGLVYFFFLSFLWEMYLEEAFQRRINLWVDRFRFKKCLFFTYFFRGWMDGEISPWPTNPPWIFEEAISKRLPPLPPIGTMNHRSGSEWSSLLNVFRLPLLFSLSELNSIVILGGAQSSQKFSIEFRRLLMRALTYSYMCSTPSYYDCIGRQPHGTSPWWMGVAMRRGARIGQPWAPWLLDTAPKTLLVTGKSVVKHFFSPSTLYSRVPGSDCLRRFLLGWLSENPEVLLHGC